MYLIFNMILLHGDDIVASRDKLTQLLTEAKLTDQEVVHLDGFKVNLGEVKQALESTSLFGQQRWVVIEWLFSRQQSYDKKQLVDYLKTRNWKLETGNLLIWEGKQLMVSQLKGFSQDSVREFKLPAPIFQFLDSFAPDQAKRNLLLFEECLKYSPTEMIFGMLIKRLRYLLVAKSEMKVLVEFKELRDWQRKKILSQATRFSVEQLVQLNNDLLEMDYELKTGKSALNLNQKLELVLGRI